MYRGPLNLLNQGKRRGSFLAGSAVDRAFGAFMISGSSREVQL